MNSAVAAACNGDFCVSDVLLPIQFCYTNRIVEALSGTRRNPRSFDLAVILYELILVPEPSFYELNDLAASLAVPHSFGKATE